MGGVDRDRVLRLMARAGPPDYRRPLPVSWWRGFLNILNTFLCDASFVGRRIADLGPGHHHLATILAIEGARVIGVERDAALADLGRALGYSIVDRDVWELTPSALDGPLDGLFSKFALRVFEAQTPDQAWEYAARLDALLSPTGWGWIAPWNGPVEIYESERMEAVAQAQIESFERLGWRCFELSEEQARFFGVKGVTYNRALFTKNLDWRSQPGRRWSLEGLRGDARFAAGALVEWDEGQDAARAWDRQRRPVFVAADAPAWRWLSERWEALGYEVAISFNTSYDELLPKTRGAILCIACVDGRIPLPERYLRRYLPASRRELEALWSERPASVARGDLSDGTTVLLVHGGETEELKRVIAGLRYEACIGLGAGRERD